MAALSNSGVLNGQTIQAAHVTQLIDAFTGVSYDLTINGTLNATGSTITGSISNAVSASKANTIQVSSLGGNTEFTVPYLQNTSSYAPVRYDASTFKYNPATSTLTVTSSYAINAQLASYFSEYVTASYNGSTIWPQGTIYTKFENTLASQSSVTEYDLLSAITTFTGNRSLSSVYTQANTIGEAKIIKFNIKGSIGGNASGGANGDINCYVKIGSTVITGTQLGTVSLSQIDNVPFEIDYELIFANNQIYGCGAIGWCKNTDFKRAALANLYSPTSTIGVNGALQFIVSGSSNIRITGSAAYVEFKN